MLAAGSVTIYGNFNAEFPAGPTGTYTVVKRCILTFDRPHNQLVKSPGSSTVFLGFKSRSAVVHCLGKHHDGSLCGDLKATD